MSMMPQILQYGYNPYYNGFNGYNGYGSFINPLLLLFLLGRPGFRGPGYGRPGYGRPGYGRPGFRGPGYGPGYNRRGRDFY